MLKLSPFIFVLDWFILKNRQTSAEGYNSVENPVELEGTVGEAVSDLRPSGTALINGERVDVITQGDFIPANSTIQVCRVKEGKIIVKKI